MSDPTIYVSIEKGRPFSFLCMLHPPHLMASFDNYHIGNCQQHKGPVAQRADHPNVWFTTTIDEAAF